MPWRREGRQRAGGASAAPPTPRGGRAWAVDPRGRARAARRARRSRHKALPGPLARRPGAAWFLHRSGTPAIPRAHIRHRVMLSSPAHQSGCGAVTQYRGQVLNCNIRIVEPTVMHHFKTRPRCCRISSRTASSRCPPRRCCPQRFGPKERRRNHAAPGRRAAGPGGALWRKRLARRAARARPQRVDSPRAAPSGGWGGRARAARSSVGTSGATVPPGPAARLPGDPGSASMQTRSIHQFSTAVIA